MLPWIVALRIFNEGSPSWCIPRKDTPSYNTIQQIRAGAKVKTPKEIREELETKTKPKKEKPRSMKVDIRDATTRAMNIPDIAEHVKSFLGSAKERWEEATSSGKDKLADSILDKYIAEHHKTIAPKDFEYPVKIGDVIMIRRDDGQMTQAKIAKKRGASWVSEPTRTGHEYVFSRTKDGWLKPTSEPGKTVYQINRDRHRQGGDWNDALRIALAHKYAESKKQKT